MLRSNLGSADMRPATDVVIRPETPADRAAVRDVVLRAFGPGEEVVADLVDALRDLPGEPMSYLAEVDGDPVGHVMLSTSLLDAPRRLVDVLVLSPLGVVPEFQRRGVGAGLIDTAMAAARAHGAPLLFLEGDPPTTPGAASSPANRRGSANRRCGSPTPRSRW